MNRLRFPEICMVGGFALLLAVIGYDAKEEGDVTPPTTTAPELRPSGWNDPARVAGYLAWRREGQPGLDLEPTPAQIAQAIEQMELADDETELR